MPVVLSPNKLYAKNQAGTDYLTANVISDQTTAEQCAAIEQKGEETLASIPSDYTNLSNQVGDLKSAKIPFPVNPRSKYGASGQLLRTLGNGSTEWVDTGLPTDEQTADAVTAWLDAHPEASTTVVDGSLTLTKFNDSLKHKTVNNYVTPEEFYAVGDGTTDDTTALQNAINYAIANDIALQLTDGKTYAITDGLVINGGWIEINKSTGIIKATSALNEPVVYISSPSIIDDRSRIGKRRVISLNLDCNGSSTGIYGEGMFEYIVRDSQIKGAVTGIEMKSPGAEVIFENCYIDGTGIADSVGIINRAADIVYSKIYMFNCHTAFDIRAYCELFNCHPWMDRNISGSIGIKTTSVCRVVNCYIDTYQKSIYKSDGSNLLMSDTIIFVSPEFYTVDLGDAYIFYGENSTDYNYSLLSNLLIATSGTTLSVKLSNINPFNVYLDNCIVETNINKSMRTSETNLKSRNDPLTSVESGITLSEQSSSQNRYAISLTINILIGNAQINAWSNIATTASALKPGYSATLIGVREDTGEAVLFYLGTNGKISTSRNLVAEKRYRITGTYLR